MLFSVACFGVKVSVMFHIMFVHFTLSSVWVVELPPFGKKLSARLVICSHCILSICINFLFIFHFGFKSGIWLLTAPVPVHCISITFSMIPKLVLQIEGG